MVNKIFRWVDEIWILNVCLVFISGQKLVVREILVVENLNSGINVLDVTRWKQWEDKLIYFCRKNTKMFLQKKLFFLKPVLKKCCMAEKQEGKRWWMHPLDRSPVSIVLLDYTLLFIVYIVKSRVSESMCALHDHRLGGESPLPLIPYSKG